MGLIPGHFATNHSHINYYVDITSIKTSHKMAKAAANELAATYAGTNVDIPAMPQQMYAITANKNIKAIKKLLLL